MSKFYQPVSAVKDHFEIYPISNYNQIHVSPEIRHTAAYDIVWVKEGGGCLIGAEHYPIENDVVYCFGPGHLLEIAGQTMLEGFYISISADLLYAAGSEFNFCFPPGRHNQQEKPAMIKMDDETQNDVWEILQRMTKEFNNYLSLRLEIMKGLLQIFLLYLSRKYITKGISGREMRDEELVRKFLHLLPGNIKTKKMVLDYASELNMTPGYLNQVVKKITGFTASYHIQQQIVQEAKKHALNSNCSMKEIAYGLGFDDIAHFSKFFKANSGVNFTHFKKEVFYVRQY